MRFEDASPIHYKSGLVINSPNRISMAPSHHEAVFLENIQIEG